MLCVVKRSTRTKLLPTPSGVIQGRTYETCKTGGTRPYSNIYVRDEPGRSFEGSTKACGTPPFHSYVYKKTRVYSRPECCFTLHNTPDRFGFS